jgi:hypothetical protein
MFYEEFSIIGEDDDAKAEYKGEEGKICYYLPHFVDGEDDIIQTITHEWLHGLFDWANFERGTKDEIIDPEGQHFIMRLIHF